VNRGSQEASSVNRQANIVPICRAHKAECCTICFEVNPEHECSAAQHLAETESEIELKCGCHIPVTADACHATNGRMAVREGKLGDQTVSVLRDGGCSTVVVKRSLIDDDRLTGAEENCISIDGTVRKVPVAEVHLVTPYFTGRVKAVCMRNPLYEVIIGNIPGVIDERDIVHTQAVMTRSQTQKEKEPTKPLKTAEEIDVNVGRDKLIEMQQEDDSLWKIFEKIEKEQQDDDLDVTFRLKKGLFISSL